MPKRSKGQTPHHSLTCEEAGWVKQFCHPHLFWACDPLGMQGSPTELRDPHLHTQMLSPIHGRLCGDRRGSQAWHFHRAKKYSIIASRITVLERNELSHMSLNPKASPVSPPVTFKGHILGKQWSAVGALQQCELWTVCLSSRSQVSHKSDAQSHSDQRAWLWKSQPRPEH